MPRCTSFVGSTFNFGFWPPSQFRLLHPDVIYHISFQQAQHLIQRNGEDKAEIKEEKGRAQRCGIIKSREKYSQRAYCRKTKLKEVRKIDRAGEEIKKKQRLRQETFEPNELQRTTRKPESWGVNRFKQQEFRYLWHLQLNFSIIYTPTHRGCSTDANKGGKVI